MSANGLVTIKSSYGPDETVNRLQSQVRAKGLTVFADIDHQEGAVAVDLLLRPTRLLIFGDTKSGTALMQSVQTVGIDLPLRVLVWQDAESATWLSYNEPEWVMNRHGVRQPVDAVVKAISATEDELTKAASSIQ